DGCTHAKSAECLPQLTADRPAAEHNQAFRFSVQLVEDRFVREIPDRIETFDFRNGCARASRDDEVFRAQNLIVDPDRVQRIESSFAAKDIDAERLKPLLRIVRCDLSAARAHTSKDFGELKLWLDFSQPPLFRSAYPVDQTRGGDQRLARD